MAARKTRRAKARRMETTASDSPDVEPKTRKRGRRDVTQTMGANSNTRALLRRMGYTAD